MAIRISGHRFKISRELRTYIEKKLPRIEKYTGDVQNMDIVIEKDGFQHLAELRFKAGPIGLTAKQKDVDPYRAVDLLMDKAEAQLKKKTEKLHGKMKHVKDISRSAKKADLSPFAEPFSLIPSRGPALSNGHAAQPERAIPVTHDKLNIRIFQSRNGEASDMTVQQAAEELFFRDETFLCFRNTDTDSINILYRRKDGHFAVMDVPQRA